MAEVSSLLAHNDFGPQTSGHSSSGAQHAPGVVVETDARGVEAVADAKLADTSSAPAAMTEDVGAAATTLAALIVEPTRAKSVAAATTISGAAMRNDMGDVPPFQGNPAGAWSPLNPRQRVSASGQRTPYFRYNYPAFRPATAERFGYAAGE